MPLANFDITHLFNLFTGEFFKESLSVLGLILILVLYLMVKTVKDFINDILKSAFSKLIKKTTIKESAGLMGYIRDRLVELRTKLDADRTYIHQFKNGDHFSAKNPVWRVFRTYEKCREGVIYQSSTIKGENASTIFEIIEPTLIGVSKSAGVIVMNCLECDQPCKKRNTVIYDIDDMPHTASRQMMLNHTVKISVQVNIIVKNNTVGILGMDFCDELSKTLIHDSEWIKKCCKTINAYADKIEYALSNPSIFKTV